MYLYYCKLLQQCQLNDDLKHDRSDVSTKAFKQSFDIMNERLIRQRAEADRHPFAISNPVVFTE